MDGSRFDALSRALATAYARRRLPRLLGGIALASPVAFLGVAEAGAKHKHHKKHKKKHRCTPSCEQKVCGDNGCGGSCGTCGTDQVCADGRCASSCPSGQKICNGTCIPSNQCCTTADCNGGAACVQGTCQCPTGQHFDDNGTCVCAGTSCPGASDGREGCCMDYVCNPGTNQCQACSVTGERCEFAGISSSFFCCGDQACFNGICARNCTDDTDCDTAAGEVCCPFQLCSTACA